MITAGEWEAAVLAVFHIAGEADGDGHRGERARRAMHQLCGPRVPDAVWNVAWAHSLVVAGLLYSSNPSNRARRARLLRDLFAEADTVKAEIGCAS